MYFKGNSEVFDQILCQQSLAFKKIKEIISYCQGYVSSCADIADQILSRIHTTNPVYWKHISLDVESLQLLYIKTQKWITTLKANIEKENIFKDQYTKDYYETIKNEINQKLSLVNSLESQVDAALINISTPIKSRNDFKLQESTERGNERILFLSFIAMSIPLISYIVSDTLSQTTKLISGIVIVALPFLYFIFNKWYKRRMANSYIKNNLEAKLVEYQEQIKVIEKQIKDFKQKKITEDETTTRIEGSMNDFTSILNQAFEEIKYREKRTKEKLKKYKRYKFE